MRKLPLSSPKLFPGVLAFVLVLAALLAACDEGQVDLPVSPDIKQAAATAVAEGDVPELERLAPTAAYQATQADSQRAGAKSVPTKDAPIPSPTPPSDTSPTIEAPTEAPTPTAERPTLTPTPVVPTPIPPDQTTPETDRAALAALYNATGGDDWKNKENWLSDKPIGSWRGVSVDPDGRVVKLDLSGNNLSGELPAELGNLAKLELLSLRDNRLSGQLPSQWGNLVNLKTLDLSNTRFGGTEASGNFGAEHCHQNRLTGTIPAEWGNLASLSNLYLSDNDLTGPLPPELGNLASLSKLYLSGNRLSGRLPAELSRLEGASLGLRENRFSGPVPQELWDSGVSLGLSHNYFTGERPERLRRNRNVYGEWANTQGNYWGREIPDQSLRLAEAATEELARAALTALYHATGGENWTNKDGWLTDAPLSEWHGVSMGRPRSYGGAGNCHGILSLRLHDNNLSGELPAELGDLVTLMVLDLSGNNLNGELPAELGNLAKLELLSLRDNRLSGQLPSQWGNLVNLKTLDLSNTRFGGTEASGNFGAEHCHQNRLTGTIPAEWGNLASLSNLYLSDNDLTGPLPPELGNLASLSKLYLSGNRLSGRLPAELSRLEGASLGLRENRFSGPVPQELWDSGVSLGLSHNYFTGERPERLRRNRNVYGEWANTQGNYWGREIPDQSLRLAEAATEELARAALTALYHATGGENWTNKDGWLTDAPLSEWHGVSMGRPRSYGGAGNCHGILSLRLHDNNLSGELPAELGDLVTLMVLDLSGNNLNGELPAELGNLAKLELLSLRDNQLTGQLPSQWGNLVNLKTLDLSNTAVSGPVPAALANLKNLRLPDADTPVRVQTAPATGQTIPTAGRPGPTTPPPGPTGPTSPTTGQPQPTTPAPEAARVDGTPETDRAALVAFYEDTGGHIWGMKEDYEDWTEEEDLNEWEGVTTNDDGRVTELLLSGEGLFTEIPPELGDLDQLTVLDLSNNELWGEIPHQLGNLVQLTALDLSNNSRLRNEIPHQLGNLTNLTSLNLDGTHFSLCLAHSLENRSIPFVLLAHYLPAEKLQGPILLGGKRPEFGDDPLDFCDAPEDWAPLIALYDATDGDNWTDNANENWKSAKPFNEWGGVTANADGRVTGLSLGDKGLSGSIPWRLGDLDQLTELDLSNNQLGGKIPGHLGYLEQLTALDLSNNQLGGEISQQLGDLTKLTSLQLGNNDPSLCLAHSLKDESVRFAILAHYNLIRFRSSGAVPLPFCHTPGEQVDRNALIEFYKATGGAEHWDVKWPVDSEPLEDPISGWHGVTTAEDRVVGLDLTGNGLNGSIPGDALGRLANLRSLSLNDNHLSGPIPTELGYLSALRTLYVGGNPMLHRYAGPAGPITVGCIPAGLKDVRHGDLDEFRGELNIDYCDHDLVHSDRAALVELYKAAGGVGWPNQANWNTNEPIKDWHGVTTDAYSRVTALNLTGNRLSGKIPEQLGRLTELRLLVLRENGLTGSLPDELGRLTNLIVLDLSDNPRSNANMLNDFEWSRLVKLEALHLANTGLKGVTPGNLVSLSNLRDLNLSRNNLTGIGELTSLGSLRVLNLSSNEFGGQMIPWSLGQLQNLEELYLVTAGLSGEIPLNFKNLKNLKVLNLGGNQLTGDIPEELEQLKNLEALYLNSNKLEGNIPWQLGHLTNLVRLDLNHNYLRGEIPVFLQYLKNLRTLRLEHNDRKYTAEGGREVTGGFNDDACVPASLRKQLRLGGHHGGGYARSNFGEKGYQVVPFCTPTQQELQEKDRAALKALYNATNGRNTWKVKWPVDDDNAHIGTWHGVTLDGEGRVTHLFLRNNGLEGEIPEETGNLDQLQVIDLSNNKLKGSIPRQLADILFRSVNNVESPNWNFTGGGDDFISNLPGGSYMSVGYKDAIRGLLDSGTAIVKGNAGKGRGWRRVGNAMSNVGKWLGRVFDSDAYEVVVLSADIYALAMSWDPDDPEASTTAALDYLGFDGERTIGVIQAFSGHLGYNVRDVDCFSRPDKPGC